MTEISWVTAVKSRSTVSNSNDCPMPIAGNENPVNLKPQTHDEDCMCSSDSGSKVQSLKSPNLANSSLPNSLLSERRSHPRTRTFNVLSVSDPQSVPNAGRESNLKEGDQCRGQEISRGVEGYISIMQTPLLLYLLSALLKNNIYNLHHQC